jgi:hypothetical protein
MNRSFGVLALLVLLVGSVAAQDKGPAFPQTVAPEFNQVWAVNRGKEVLGLVVQEQVPVAREVTVPVDRDGRQVKEKRTITEMVTVTRVQEFAVQDLQASDGAGKKLTGDELLRRIKVGQMVLTTRDPKGVDPAFRAVLSPDAVILVLPKGQKVIPGNKP